MDWFTAFMHRFSYSSKPASFSSFTVACLDTSRTYFMRSFSSTEPRFANGKPTTTTALANSSEKFNPSDSLAPTTAKRTAPDLFAPPSFA